MGRARGKGEDWGKDKGERGGLSRGGWGRTEGEEER